MKNNLDFYRHDVHAHENSKFKMLRVRFGWEGDGKFWALNSIIAKSDGCWLDISKQHILLSTAADLGFTVEDFVVFVNFLSDKKQCDLLINNNGKITTNEIQERLKEVNITREKARLRKLRGFREKEEGSGELFNNSYEEEDNSPEPTKKVKESKVNKNSLKRIEEDFDLFWKKYPNKKGKQEAKKYFTKLLKEKPDLMPLIFEAIDAQILWRKKCEDKKIFAPDWKHPIRWLKYGCWEDSVEIAGEAQKAKIKIIQNAEVEKRRREEEEAEKQRLAVDSWVAQNNEEWRKILAESEDRLRKKNPNFPITDVMIRIEARVIVIERYLKNSNA